MARTALDALLGRLLFDGVESELLGGLNFAGFTVEVEDGYYTVTSLPGSSITSAQYTLNPTTFFDVQISSSLKFRIYSGGVDLFGNGMIGVASINGATVAAPVQGTAVTTTATVTVAGGNNYVVSSAGGAYSITVGTGGSPYTGEVISFICSAALANAITLVNGGPGGTNIEPSAGTIPAGQKLVVDVVFGGTNWALAGVKRLA